MRHHIEIPPFESRKELYSFLRKSADRFAAQKKSLPIWSDDFDFGYSLITEQKTTAKKDDGPMPDGPSTEGEIKVEVIANVSGWCDSQMDVMIKDSWNKSINDTGASGQKLVYHLKDHGTNCQYTLDSIIGKDCSLFTKNIDLSMFNFSSDIKKAQALMMSSTVCADYDEKAYNLYEDGEVKQHSIGLQYIKIFLCMDSTEEEDTMYKENWDKYYPSVINKDKVDSSGFFWAVTEARILEVSAVLFGSNELTPTTSTGKSTTTQPPVSTVKQPPQAVNWDKIANFLIN